MPPLAEHLAPDPVAALSMWMNEALTHGQPQPPAMWFATPGVHGRPSSRAPFLRGWGPHGVAWLTDDASRTAREIRPPADSAGVLFWPGLPCSVRGEGPVHPLE